MSRPKKAKNKVRRPVKWTRLRPNLLERMERQLAELARLRWWERNRPPGY